MKLIDVIGSFDIDGNIRPIKFRVVEEEENLVVSINKILSRDRSKDKIVYKTECIINGFSRLIEIVFYINDMKWYCNLE